MDKAIRRILDTIHEDKEVVVSLKDAKFIEAMRYVGIHQRDKQLSITQRAQALDIVERYIDRILKRRNSNTKSSRATKSKR